MLSLDDLMGMCDCTEEEIEAIAIHEHVPDAVASEMAAYLIHCPDGVPRIRKIIVEDIEEARSKGDSHCRCRSWIRRRYGTRRPAHYLHVATFADPIPSSA